MHVNERCRLENEFEETSERWGLLKVQENALRKTFEHIDQQLHGRFFVYIILNQIYNLAFYGRNKILSKPCKHKTNVNEKCLS